MLKLSDAAYREVRRHGEETYPHECCGVLLGLSLDGAQASVNQVEAVVRAGNTRTDSAHNRYQISPHELVKIQREARETGAGHCRLLPLASRSSGALVAD